MRLFSNGFGGWGLGGLRRCLVKYVVEECDLGRPGRGPDTNGELLGSPFATYELLLLITGLVFAETLAEPLGDWVLKGGVYGICVVFVLRSRGILVLQGGQRLVCSSFL